MLCQCILAVQYTLSESYLSKSISPLTHSSIPFHLLGIYCQTDSGISVVTYRDLLSMADDFVLMWFKYQPAKKLQVI